MKRIFSLLVLSLVIQVSFSQTPLTYSEVVQVDSITSKEEMFERARVWFATSFKDSKEVLQVSDKENGELIGRGVIPFISNVFVGSSATKGLISFDVRIYTKQGRYKYEITLFTHEGSSGSSQGIQYPAISFGIITTDSLCPKGKVSEDLYNYKWQNKLWLDLKEKIQTDIPSLVQSLKSSMVVVSPAKKDDW
mgnify:CR=1 FL=1